MVVFGGLQVIDGEKQLGVVVSFIGYLRLALGPLPDVGGLYTSYQEGMAGLDQIFELLDERSEVTDRSGASTSAGARRYRAGERALRLRARAPERARRRLDEDRPQETAALVGSTGAGKTTIVKPSSASMTSTRAGSSSTGTT